MKKFLIVMSLLFAFTLSAQEEKEKAKLEWAPLFRVSLLQPFSFGDHALAKAHDAKLGFGLSLQFLEYNKFRLGFGYDMVKYEVTDKTKIGNIGYSNYGSVYGIASYDLRITDKFRLYPNIGYGSVKVQMRTGRSKFGHQTGNDYRLGMIGNYSLNKTFSVFGGVHYIHTNLDVVTSPEYVDFFGKADQIQISFGIQMD